MQDAVISGKEKPTSSGLGLKEESNHTNLVGGLSYRHAVSSSHFVTEPRHDTGYCMSGDRRLGLRLGSGNQGQFAMA